MLADLKKIGLTEGELRIYSALAEQGEMTRTRLAKFSGISPSKVYDVTNRLHEKGIISIVKKNGVLHFASAEPETLLAFVQRKRSELEEEERLVRQMLPALTAQHMRMRPDTEIEVFQGWDGMTTVFDELVRAVHPDDFDYVFGASKGYSSAQADLFFNRYYEQKRQKGFGTKIIFNENMRGYDTRTSIFREPPNEMRFLAEDTFAEINTYGDVVLLILLLKKPLVVRIRSEEAAASFRSFFDSLWKQAKK